MLIRLNESATFSAGFLLLSLVLIVIMVTGLCRNDRRCAIRFYRLENELIRAGSF
uniref:Uncharacterized protein n=1 Tax=Globodera pallida TaxID=36090 RepID=A0A183CR77_GLOPA